MPRLFQSSATKCYQYYKTLQKGHKIQIQNKLDTIQLEIEHPFKLNFAIAKRQVHNLYFEMYF